MKKLLITSLTLLSFCANAGIKGKKSPQRKPIVRPADITSRAQMYQLILSRKLLDALTSNKIEHALSLIDKGAGNLSPDNPFGILAFVIAARVKDVRPIKALLEKRKPNQVLLDNTLFELVCFAHKKEKHVDYFQHWHSQEWLTSRVALLLNYGANPHTPIVQAATNDTKEEETTSYQRAIEYQLPHLVKLFDNITN